MRAIHTKIVGVSYRNKDGSSRQKILRRMFEEGCEYENVYLEAEPDNQHDKNAVKVLNCDDEQLGYLNRDLAKDISKMLSNGIEFEAFITEITGTEDEGLTLGCNIEITEIENEPKIYRLDLYGNELPSENKSEKTKYHKAHKNIKSNSFTKILKRIFYFFTGILIFSALMSSHEKSSFFIIAFIFFLGYLTAKKSKS